MPVEYRAVKIAFDSEAGLYWVNDFDPAFRHLTCEARTISALHKKVARALSAPISAVELRLLSTPRG